MEKIDEQRAKPTSLLMPVQRSMGLEEIIENLVIGIQLAAQRNLEDFSDQFADYEAFLKALKQKPLDPKLIYLLRERDCNSSRDADIAIANIDLLTPGLLSQICEGESALFKGDLSGSDSRVYVENRVAEGRYGELFDAFYVTPGSTILRPGIVKKPRCPVGIDVFQHETIMAATISHLIKANPDHPGSEHVVRPLGWNKRLIVLDRLIVHPETSIDGSETSAESSGLKLAPSLFDLGIEKMKPDKLFENLAGIALAFDFLSKNGIINLDGNLSNMLCTSRGGVLIDLATLLDTRDTSAKVVHNPFDRHIDCQDIYENEFVLRGAPFFLDYSIVEAELAGTLPKNVSAKVNLAMVLADFLIEHKFIKSNFLPNLFSPKFGINVPDIHQKKSVSPPQLTSNATSQIKEVYDLFLKLFAYWYSNDTGLPRENISLTDAAIQFYRLAKIRL